MICVITISLGYLLGSILPAYYFGRLAGVDIRCEGAKYAGTINVYHVVGNGAAIATAIFDLCKGMIAVQIALALGASFSCAQISGIAAVVGHVLPFYLNFRGGQGVACATGILLYYLLHYLTLKVLHLEILGFFALIMLLFAYIARQGEVISVIILPLLSYSILVHAPNDDFNPYLVLIALYIVSVGIYNIWTRKLLVISDPLLRSHWWRVVLRPVAVIFVLYYWNHSRNATLLLIGAPTLIFLLLDLIRLQSEKVNTELLRKIRPLFKTKEQRRCSSMSLFLVATFLTVLVFDRMIAIASLIFLIFGDLFSKIFGLAYGRQKIGNKTVEGSLAYLGVALIAVYVLATTTPVPFLLLLIGAMVAAIVEALPLPIDDNFSVAIVTATALTIAQKFFFGF